MCGKKTTNRQRGNRRKDDDLGEFSTRTWVAALVALRSPVSRSRDGTTGFVSATAAILGAGMVSQQQFREIRNVPNRLFSSADCRGSPNPTLRESGDVTPFRSF